MAATPRYVIVPLGVDDLTPDVRARLVEAVDPIEVTFGPLTDPESRATIAVTSRSDHTKASGTQAAIYDAALALGLAPSRGAITTEAGYVDFEPQPEVDA